MNCICRCDIISPRIAVRAARTTHSGAPRHQRCKSERAADEKDSDHRTSSR